jgi:hypothetical protein
MTQITWTDDYEPGQEVLALNGGNWRRCTVVTVRSRSVMASATGGNIAVTFNIHDPRNIKPCPKPTPEQTSPTTEQLSLES